jgi:DedD protein
VKRERFIILLGILVALVFFYLGLNEWLKTKEEQVQPPPLVVKPLPQEKETAKPVPQKEEVPPVAKEAKQETSQQKSEGKQPPKGKEQDVIAQKIREERNTVKPAENKAEPKTSERRESPTTKPKTYTVQLGAFKGREGAERVAEKAKKMGYRVNIVEEDNFYKVRLSVRTENIEDELRKLRSVFGSAILK